MGDYDDQYRRTKDLFGAGPEAVLCRHLSALPRGLPILDIGTGQGRNALYLARQGFHVDAIDPSAVATDAVAVAVAKEDLPIHVQTGSFADHEAATGSYGGVLVFGLIQILSWESIGLLAERVEQWLCPGGLALITAWTTADASRASCANEWMAIGRNSYRGDDGTIRTYLEPGALPAVFPGFDTIHHWEGLGPRHRHGDGPIEQHSVVEAVLRRRG